MGALLLATAILMYSTMTRQATPLAYQTSGLTIAWLPETVQRWEGSMKEFGKKYNVDPNLLAIIITMESGGYPQARSEAGAQGLMQIMPGTAQDIAAKFLKQPRTTYDIYDPATNIEFGAAYLAYLRDTFGSESQDPDWNSVVELVAAGYNGGPGAARNLEKGNGLRNMQTVAYSRDAYNMWRERHAPSSPTFERWAERGGSHLISKARNQP